MRVRRKEAANSYPLAVVSSVNAWQRADAFHRVRGAFRTGRGYLPVTRAGADQEE